MKKVYVITDGDRLKIGAAKDVAKRTKQIRTGCPNAYVAYESEPISNAFKVEKMLHREFESFAIGHEWFSGVDRNQVIERVKIAVSEHGCFAEKEARRSDESYERLMKLLFCESEDYIRRVDKEIEEINKEIEQLKEQAREIGISEWKIQKIIDDAKALVCLSA